MTIETYYRENKNKLVNYIQYKLNGDYNAAEDVVAEAFSRALKYEDSKSSHEFHRWFSRIMYNCLSEHNRNKHGIVKETLEQWPNLPEVDRQIVDDFRFSLEALIDLVPNERHRQVLSLYFFSGYNAADINQVVGISENNVKKIVWRFRAALKKIRRREDDV